MDWLKKIRKERGLSQAEVARESKITSAEYNRFENNLRSPNPKKAKKIASVLGFDWTLFYEDEPREKVSGTKF